MQTYGRPREAWQPFDSVLYPAFMDLFLPRRSQSDSMLQALKRKQKLKSRLVILLRPRQTKALCKVKFSSDRNDRGKEGEEDKVPALGEKLKLQSPYMPWLSIIFHLKPVHFSPIILYCFMLTYALLLVIKRL